MSLPVEAIIHAIRASKTPEAAANLILVYENIQRKVAERKREAEEILSYARAKVAQMMQEDLCHLRELRQHRNTDHLAARFD
jgi:hypothetical protein